MDNPNTVFRKASLGKALEFIVVFGLAVLSMPILEDATQQNPLSVLPPSSPSSIQLTSWTERVGVSPSLYRPTSPSG